MRTLCLALLLVLAACAKPVPPEKHAFVGEWSGDNMWLLIEEGGRVEYLREEGNSRRSLEAPLKRFVGDDFEVGVGPLTTTFDVTEPPHRVDGGWRMTVDGVVLTRVD